MNMDEFPGTCPTKECNLAFNMEVQLFDGNSGQRIDLSALFADDWMHC